jgi:hypothetical protein
LAKRKTFDREMSGVILKNILEVKETVKVSIKGEGPVIQMAGALD